MKKELFLIASFLIVFSTFFTACSTPQKAEKVSFVYSKTADLVYHVMSYFDVKNASTEYDPEYQECMDALRPGKIDLNEETVQYYNAHFERLCYVTFICFYTDDFEEYCNTILNFPYITDTDRQEFIIPFIKVLRSEKNFYSKWWDEQFEKSAKSRKSLERYIKFRLDKYDSFFANKGTKRIIFLCFSLNQNGRGITYNDGVGAAVPYSFKKSGFASCFLTILHEFTHQVTDSMIKGIISMKDGSHDFSEKLVYATDYCLIEKFEKHKLSEYCQYFGCSKKLDRTDFYNYIDLPIDAEYYIMDLGL